jgi:hypothetical protein
MAGHRRLPARAWRLTRFPGAELWTISCTSREAAAAVDHEALAGDIARRL